MTASFMVLGFVFSLSNVVLISVQFPGSSFTEVVRMILEKCILRRFLQKWWVGLSSDSSSNSHIYGQPSSSHSSIVFEETNISALFFDRQPFK